MKVSWEDVSYSAYDYACKEYPEEAKIEDFIHKHEGEVLGSFTSGFFFKKAMFLVNEKGSIVEVQASKCKVIKEDKQ